MGLNYIFKIQDYSYTKKRHAKQIQKIRDSGITYRDIISYEIIDDLVCDVQGEPWWSFLFVREMEKNKLTQSLLKQIKSRVNQVMREYIARNLVLEGLPASYDTAFYIIHYDRINNLMNMITKELVKDYK